MEASGHRINSFPAMPPARLAVALSLVLVALECRPTHAFQAPALAPSSRGPVSARPGGIRTGMSLRPSPPAAVAGVRMGGSDCEGTPGPSAQTSRNGGSLVLDRPRGGAVTPIADDKGLDGMSPERESGLQTFMREWWPKMLLLGVCIISGSNFACGKIITSNLAPSVGATLRFLVGFLVLAPGLKNIDLSLAPRAIWGAFWIALGYCAQIASLQTIAAGKVGFICALSVIVCNILECIIDRKPVTRGLILSVLLSIAGVAVLELSGGPVGFGVGDMLAFLQPVGFGIGYFMSERLIKSNPTQLLQITALQGGVYAAVAGTWMLMAGIASGGFAAGTMFVGLAKASWAAIYCGIVTTALCGLGFAKSLEGLSASEASMIFTTEPVWALMFAAALVGEAIKLPAVVGACLIMAACSANFLWDDDKVLIEMAPEDDEIEEIKARTVFKEKTA
eukprot:CAMPEP_0206243256 /NCGR_PEP_ID=MMETSP0047_2-20121206/17513_1 /ASSEMBLY_ACC=CAM_ASM_000192 /TAXON_ID=195065 /ORGANISM="Chroomonas mesostigmatica_cf, Strain CCMP1168" /LENGTH=449 /DNA_ID=CAMNT_0053668369 /DNA_START=90 /DNA_END=1439 /DNA_ORIENTATION=+